MSKETPGQCQNFWKVQLHPERQLLHCIWPVPLGRTVMPTSCIAAAGLGSRTFSDNSSPAKAGGISFKDGPLTLALQKGSTLVMDEQNLAPHEVHRMVSYAVSMPAGSEVYDPVSGRNIKVAVGFWVLATQNPVGFLGRNALPDELIRRFHACNIPPYTKEELKEILKAKLADMFETRLSSVDAESMSDLLAQSDAMSLRMLVKLARRAVDESFTLARFNQQLFLHTQLMVHDFDAVSTAADEIRFKILRSSEPPLWTFSAEFSAEGSSSAVSVALPAAPHLEMLQDEVQKLGPAETEVLVKLAFALKHSEPVLLIGPTSFKSWLMSLLARMVSFGGALTTIYASAATGVDELAGGLEPHVQDSYKSYCEHVLRIIEPRGHEAASEPDDAAGRHEATRKPLADRLKRMQQVFEGTPSTREWLQSMVDKLSAHGGGKAQFFCFCERGLLPFARCGGLVVIKHMNLISASVLEGFNTLLDVDKSFTLLGKEVTVHPNFRIAGVVHSRGQEEFSPAVISRFTIVQVPQPAVKVPSRCPWSPDRTGGVPPLKLWPLKRCCQTKQRVR